MKLQGRDARRMCDAPEKRLHGFLLYGPDASEVAARRETLVKALLGGDEMALVRMEAAEARKDPAALTDALRAQGFFGGRPVVHLESITDTMAEKLRTALDGLTSDQGVLVATAGQLNARSALRKMFEGSGDMVAMGLYPDPPDRAEIADMLKAWNAPLPDRDAEADLLALANALDAGEFRSFIERLSLYKGSEDSPISSDDVAQCAPQALEGEIDEVINAVANAQTARIPAALSKIIGQGINPTTIVIGLERHFKQLHALSSASDGPDAAIARARPPIFGPRRNAMLGQCRKWGVRKSEAALKSLLDADLLLRSSSNAPQRAALERALVRISMIGAR